MEKVKFTNLEDVKFFEDGFIYIAIVYCEEVDANAYETLKYKTDELLIWDCDKSSYIELSESQEVISVAKLSKFGSNIF